MGDSGNALADLSIDGSTDRLTVVQSREPINHNYKKWVDDYGEDSDFVRVRVRGQFPRAGSMQLIPSDIVTKAATRPDVSWNPTDPLIMAIDVARFGDDQSVIAFRRGRNGRHIPSRKYRGIDTMQLQA